MKPDKLREDAKCMIGNRGPREIVDEPSDGCVRFHPAEKLNDLLVGEMMREQRTDDQIGRMRRRVGIDVDGNPADFTARRRGFRSDSGGVGVEIEPG